MKGGNCGYGIRWLVWVAQAQGAIHLGGPLQSLAWAVAQGFPSLAAPQNHQVQSLPKVLDMYEEGLEMSPAFLLLA